jgi:hypothetical protein
MYFFLIKCAQSFVCHTCECISPKKCSHMQRHFTEHVATRVYLTVGNRPGYRGNRPYRRGSVGVTDRFFDKTDPTKPTFSVNRSKTSVNRTGFVGFENRYCSGF